MGVYQAAAAAAEACARMWAEGRRVTQLSRAARRTVAAALVQRLREQLQTDHTDWAVAPTDAKEAVEWAARCSEALQCCQVRALNV
jgi:hypothetical protein